MPTNRQYIELSLFEGSNELRQSGYVGRRMGLWAKEAAQQVDFEERTEIRKLARRSALGHCFRSAPNFLISRPADLCVGFLTNVFVIK